MAIEHDNKRNEPRPAIGERNELPKAGAVDVRGHGLAGRRVLLDRALRAVDGFGVAQFAAAGTSVREIAEERDTVALLLDRVVRYDGRRPSRQRQRSAALRLLGHLRAAAHADLIAEIASARDEPVTVRAAAFDALGMLGEKSTADVVARHIDDDDDRIAARALWALGRLGGKDHLAELERRLDSAPSRARYDAVLDAIAALGVGLGIPVAVPERDRRRPEPQRTR